MSGNRAERGGQTDLSQSIASTRIGFRGAPPIPPSCHRNAKAGEPQAPKCTVRRGHLLAVRGLRCPAIIVLCFMTCTHINLAGAETAKLHRISSSIVQNTCFIPVGCLACPGGPLTYSHPLLACTQSGLDSGIAIADMVINVFFMTDVVMTFRTAYICES